MLLFGSSRIPDIWANTGGVRKAKHGSRSVIVNGTETDVTVPNPPH
jgi:hypothetical protein